MNIENFMNQAPEIIRGKFLHRKYSKGSPIIFQGEKNDYLFILKKGCANVITQNALGEEFVLYTYEAYSYFGELELFNKNMKTVHVVCNTDCEVSILHEDYVFEWMKLDFGFSKFLFEQLTEKLLYSARQLIWLSSLNIKDRLISCIYAHHKNGSLSKITKDAVCAEILVPLRSLNRAIAECKKEGYFEYENKTFKILSVEKLQKCIELDVFNIF
ncbi:Crp/Fnr family transcriptional regulator [Anaerotignum sp. MB30-C6]|uniref:Crp/Fnr family transcriptional regulator n=1 Tax=Anaerotignum sp. MB30-C6 TaxID=3070814 RepID=UPI0027DB19CF|nr:Crp/Fnr family transcriptional regulator [Anaerotignum sp. MB30-C6]WMI82165.1 Crp/Fnr family transcriptional regulator [Anaerotignum sp. MB30-C6]